MLASTSDSEHVSDDESNDKVGFPTLSLRLNIHGLVLFFLVRCILNSRNILSFLKYILVGPRFCDQDFDHVSPTMDNPWPKIVIMG